MRELPSPTAGSARASSRRELVGKLLRYFAGSVVAAVCSETTFLLLYGALTTSPAVASSLGWLAGAAPNYWLNRTWTWRRHGKPSFTRRSCPTPRSSSAPFCSPPSQPASSTPRWLNDGTSDSLRLVLVGGTFLAVYGVVFLLRFLLLDQLFRRGETSATSDAVGPVSAREPA